MIGTDRGVTGLNSSRVRCGNETLRVEFVNERVCVLEDPASDGKIYCQPRPFLALTAKKSITSELSQHNKTQNSKQ